MRESPAIDGYAHVEPTCLVNSTTNIEFDRAETSRLEQIAWIEKYASYDGLAVRWGIGHKAATAEQCAQSAENTFQGEAVVRSTIFHATRSSGATSPTTCVSNPMHTCTRQETVG